MVSRRGTTNTNARGNNTTRKRRREAMVENWRADVDLPDLPDVQFPPPEVRLGHGIPACRCWRCGKLLTADTVTIDRWPVPGIDGGKYTATNTRPACATCNPTTGATVRKGLSGKQLLLVILDELRV